MEPSNERFLRVNHSQTALVLGGTVSSGLPPDLLVSRSKVPMPLQEDTVNLLASVLSPPLCPSALASKLRVAVLLHGLPGTFASVSSRNTFISILKCSNLSGEQCYGKTRKRLVFVFPVTVIWVKQKFVPLLDAYIINESGANNFLYLILV